MNNGPENSKRSQLRIEVQIDLPIRRGNCLKYHLTDCEKPGIEPKTGIHVKDQIRGLCQYGNTCTPFRVLKSYLLTVKAAPHECVIRTDLP